jgi:hypothetical protein
MLEPLAASFLIEILPAERFLRARDSCKFKLDRATDGLKETILEVAPMVRPEDSAAGVLAFLREMAVIRDGAMRGVYHIRDLPSHWLALRVAVCTQTHTS